MFGAFAARLPVERYVPWFAEAASASKRAFGSAPIAVGLMQVDAFNFPPLNSGRLFMLQVSWSRDGHRRYLFSVPASRADIRVSDMLFYQTQTSFNSLQPDGLCFQPGFASALVSRLAVRAVLTRREFVGGEFHLRMAAYDIPSAEDFRAYRYVPLRYYDVCEASFPADNLKAQRFQYFPEGVDAISAWSAVPFKVSVAGIPLVVNYPCRAEAQRIAYWFDHPQLAERDPGAEERVRQFMDASLTKSGMACLAEALPAVSMMHTNWREGYPPPPGASCEHDLASGLAMLASGLDVIVRDARETVELAVAANARGDHGSCLLQVAAVRRAFYASLGSPAVSEGGGSR